MTKHLAALRERLTEIEDLRVAMDVLHWDQQTNMPPRGAEQRADALGTLERISHRRFIDAEVGRLLEGAERELQGQDFFHDDVCLVRLTRRRWEKARRVPDELASELVHAASIGQEAWAQARRDRDFGAFAPHLERNLALARRYVECFDSFEHPYDVLLDDYEPDMTTGEVGRLFETMKAGLVPIISELAAQDSERSIVFGSFPVERQRRLVAQVIQMMGFDSSGWRIDDAVHPFATSFGPQDVRITNRFDESYFPAGLYGAMHECGHGLYEAGVSADLRRTPLGHPESLAMHESQSRLWENMVGRSREFCGVLAPLLSELVGGSLSGLEPDQLFRAVNRVVPSFIRVEADEATYGLHIIMRFELEQELIEDRLPVAELPEAWNARVRDYLGLEVSDPADGVLQDVHWSAGLIGYFPTYALGNMIAGQLWRAAHDDLSDLDQCIAAGELGPLREWLREKVHRHGSKFRTRELLQRVVGGPIDPQPFLDHLRSKLGEVYELTLPAPRPVGTGRALDPRTQPANEE
jgi:carboxypeptidase Taq